MSEDLIVDEAGAAGSTSIFDLGRTRPQLGRRLHAHKLL
jgi:hypothetical protein